MGQETVKLTLLFANSHIESEKNQHHAEQTQKYLKLFLC
jgi:hypothetical protein